MLHSTKHPLLTHKKPRRIEKPPKVMVGWQEWCALPKLHIPGIKAKIDTGAKTSALHAWDIRPFFRHNELHVHFTVHPIQRNTRISKRCTAKIIDQRKVKASSGHEENRYVISTMISLGSMTWEIEITLTNRDAMAFRMLLGRDALSGHSIVDPGKILCQGRLTKNLINTLYREE